MSKLPHSAAAPNVPPFGSVHTSESVSRVANLQPGASIDWERLIGTLLDDARIPPTAKRMAFRVAKMCGLEGRPLRPAEICLASHIRTPRTLSQYRATLQELDVLVIERTGSSTVYRLHPRFAA